MTRTDEIDALMRLVKRRADDYRQQEARGVLVLPDHLPTLVRASVPGQSSIPCHPRFHVRELLALNGPDLVRGAYQRILWRDATPDEVAWRTDQLRLGAVAPSQLLRQIRYSPEGIRCGVVIVGLEWHRWLRAPLKVPVIRKFWRILLALSELPHLKEQAHRALVEQRTRIDRHDDALRGLVGIAIDGNPAPAAHALRQRIAALEARLEMLEQGRSAATEALK